MSPVRYSNRRNPYRGQRLSKADSEFALGLIEPTDEAKAKAEAKAEQEKEDDDEGQASE